MSVSTFRDITEYRKVYGEAPALDGYRLPSFANQTELDGGYPPNWFLGPRAENLELFVELLIDAANSNAVFRRSFHPEDGAAIHETDKIGDAYLRGVDTLRQAFSELLASLRHDTTPYYSWRYQGHMLWDTTLPAMLGYVATMLHNPNNVTIQASTLTTFLEQLVGWDLCGMLGFPFPDLGREALDHEIVPHGHLTSGGTVANIEATWSARELKYLPVLVHAALTESDSPLYWYSDRQKARIRVQRADGETVPILDLDQWDLLNIRQDSALQLPLSIHRLGAPDLPGDRMQLRWRERDVWEFLLPGSANALGMAGVYGEYLSKEYLTPIGGPVILGPVTWHYSWPKAMGLLGGGSTSGILPVNVGPLGRMDIDDLTLQLNRAQAARNPVLLVVAVLGSTEESAVDDLVEVLNVRERFRSRGLEFNVHVDAAWGGYFASVLRKDYRDPGDDNRPSGGDPYLRPDRYAYARPGHGDPHAWDVVPTGEGAGLGFLAEYPAFLSDHTRSQIEAIRRADSATVDPHKTGYVPYPAGAVCYRNGEIRRLVTYGAPVIGSSETALSVGEYGVEGSKPGAAAAAVYLSHAVIRPSHSGHGRLMNASLINTRLLYGGLLALNLNQDDFVAIPLVDLRRRDGSWWSRDDLSLRRGYARWLAGSGAVPWGPLEDLSDVIERVLVDVHSRQPDSLPPEDYAWLRGVGPDLNIVDYMFNFRTDDGAVNTDLRLLNRFNRAVYDRFHVAEGAIVGGSLVRDVEIHDLPVLVSKTEIFRDTYGDDFVVPFLERLGVDVFGPGRQEVVRILQTRDPDARDAGERLLDCYRKIIVMRSVVMDPFLHARSSTGEFFVDEWTEIVSEVVGDEARRFRKGDYDPDGDCGDA